MNYEKRIVCYFDILGFSKIVCDKTLQSNQIKALFDELSVIINEYTEDNINIHHFSDSFAISIQHRTKALKQLKFIIDVLEKLLQYSLLARGTIVYGEILHYDKNIFGPALVKAVYLEEKEAKYPRIILDDSLDELPLPTIGTGKTTYREYFNNFMFVKRDHKDSIFYIDFLGELNKNGLLNRYKTILNALINKGIALDDQNIADKYKWLKDKLELVNNLS